MCWSGEASAVLATAGLASTAYVAYKGEKKELWMPLGYFSLMELLQAFTYYYIGQCDAPPNHILTVLGYLHIAFQPFFVNMVSMHFIPDRIKNKIRDWVYAICFAGAILTILKLYPFEWAQGCLTGKEPMCGQSLCSVYGNWHIAWNIPINSIPYIQMLGYAFPVFILPLFYGSWRFTAYHYIIGPLMAHQLTDNLNEWPAVWCLFSIGLLLIVIKTPIRQLLYVKDWYGCPYPKKKKKP